MKRDIKLEAKDFGTFVRCLSILKGVCYEVHISGGVLRQKSDDKTILFEMDLSTLISDCNMVLPDLKRELILLKNLSKQEVTITITDNDISFSGEHSSFKFFMPVPNVFPKHFISEDKMASMFPFTKEDMVLMYPVKKETSSLIKVISSQFKPDDFIIFFNRDTASIVTIKDKYLRSDLDQGIPVEKPRYGLSDTLIQPFLMDHDSNIIYRLYDVSGREDSLLHKWTTSVGGITLNTFYTTRFTDLKQFN